MQNERYEGEGAGPSNAEIKEIDPNTEEMIMLLKDIAKAAPGLVRIIGNENKEVYAVCSDSRKVVSGALFFCIPGMRYDAHNYAPQVKEAGAAAIVVDHELPLDIPQVLVKDVRNALSYMAAAFYGNPAKKLHMIGLTGTKGKTTTSFLIKSILEKMGHKVGLIGTVCSMIGDEELPATLTTPDSIDLQRLLLKMVDSGVTHVVMEVSAHALAMERVAGICFDAAAFTNFSQDHLDYFHTMENYLQAKMRLFDPDMCKKAAYNCDDDSTKCLEGRGFTRAGISADSDVFAKEIEIGERGCQFMLTFYRRFSVHVSLRLAGIFNVYNALLAASVCDLLGATGEQICEGLEAVAGVPGRIELLDTDTPYRVILDYAHSPDSLENILKAIRQTAKQRVIALFGCGGDRDHEKRPVMGEIGGRLADYCILTSDNPRGEAPYEILKSIEEGIMKTDCDYTVIENRREAILYGLRICRPGDVLVLAGKGHETYQEIRGVKYPFDEKVVVKELLEKHAPEAARV